MAKDTKIYEVIFWVAIALIALWVIFKVLGLIGSPFWIEAIPYAGGLFAAGAAFQILKDTKNSVKVLTRRVGRIGEGLTKVEIEVKHLERDIEKIKK